MPGEYKLALQILVPIPLVKRACGDEVFALHTDVLRKDGVAVEGIEGDI